MARARVTWEAAEAAEAETETETETTQRRSRKKRTASEEQPAVFTWKHKPSQALSSRRRG